MSSETVLLFVLLLIGHFLGDFSPLATRKMQEAKVGARPPGLIAAHAAVHAILTLGAVAAIVSDWSLVLTAAAVQFGTHLIIDYTKMKLGVRYATFQDPESGPYWYLFGADQLAHQLVLVAIAAMVL